MCFLSRHDAYGILNDGDVRLESDCPIPEQMKVVCTSDLDSLDCVERLSYKAHSKASKGWQDDKQKLDANAI